MADFFSGLVSGTMQGMDWREGRDDRARRRKIEDERFQWEGEDRSRRTKNEEEDRTYTREERARRRKEEDRALAQRDAELAAWGEYADQVKAERDGEGRLSTSGQSAAPAAQGGDAFPIAPSAPLSYGDISVRPPASAGAAGAGPALPGTVAQDAAPNVPAEVAPPPSGQPPASMRSPNTDTPVSASEAMRSSLTPEEAAMTPRYGTTDIPAGPGGALPAGVEPAGLGTIISDIVFGNRFKDPENVKKMLSAGEINETEAKIITRGSSSEVDKIMRVVLDRRKTGQKAPPDGAPSAGNVAAPSPQAPASAAPSQGNVSDLVPFDPSRFQPRQNADGSVSTELTATEDAPDGGYWNIPTLWFDSAGKPHELSVQEASNRAKAYEQQTGRRFPRYKSVQEGEAAATARSAAGGAQGGRLDASIGSATVSPPVQKPQAPDAPPAHAQAAPPAPPTTAQGTPVESIATAAETAPKLSFGIIGKDGAVKTTEKATSRAVDAGMKAYRTEKVPAIVEHYIRTGQWEKAQAFEKFLDDEKTKAGMRQWMGAIHALNVGDADRFIDGIVGAYNSYFADGYTALKDQSEFNKDENGNLVSATVAFRNDETGEVFKQTYSSVQDMLMAVIGQLSPEGAYDTLYDLHMKPKATGAAKPPSVTDVIEKLSKSNLEFAGKSLEEQIAIAQAVIAQTTGGAAAEAPMVTADDLSD